MANKKVFTPKKNNKWSDSENWNNLTEEELKEKLKAFEYDKNKEFEAAFKKFAEEWKMKLIPVINIGGKKYMPDAFFSQAVKIDIVIKRGN